MPAVPNLVMSKPKRGAAMGKKLQVADLGDLLEQPLIELGRLRAWDFADEEVFH